jgi:hypothetical protein
MAKDLKKDTKKLVRRIQNKLTSFFRFRGIGKGKFNLAHFTILLLIVSFLCYLFWFSLIKKN